jgi:lysophospholipase L1-like esterase
MAYGSLKNAIQNAVDWDNNDNQITGDIMLSVLLTMINSLGAEYQFVGVAGPTTNPGTPDQKVFYIASKAGTYVNFGGIVVNSGEVAIIKGSGSSWSKEVTGAAAFADVYKRLVDCVTRATSVNLFDKDSAEVITGKYITASGYQDINHGVISHPIWMTAGTAYKWPQYSFVGNNTHIAAVDASGNYVGDVTGTISDGFLTFTPSVSGFYRVNLVDAHLVDFMVCESALYPAEYVPFELSVGARYGLSERQTEQVNAMISDLSEIAGYFDKNQSVNLFDKYATLIKNGYYSGVGFNPSESYRVSAPIKVQGGVSYTAIYYAGNLGQNNPAVAIVNAQNEIISMAVGTINEAKDRLTFTPSEDMLVSFNVGKTDKLASMMACKTADFPETYVPYYDYTELVGVVVSADAVASRLTGKSVIFAGDSICAGAQDSYGGGYARRIGERNNMVWQNLARGGATIIDDALVGSSASISETDFGAGADFIILEGGTNDADRIGSIIGGGDPPALFGSFSPTGYQTAFTNQTFCGAVEYLIKHIVTDFPEAKVGFIIAPKMGVTNDYTKTGNNRRAYFETIIEICHKWGVPVLNLWDECTMNPRIASHYTSGQDYLYADGQHPTAKGYDFLTPIIEAWMLTL